MNSRSSTPTHAMNHVTPIPKESDTADSSCLAAAGVATSAARRTFVARVTLCGDGRVGTASHSRDRGAAAPGAGSPETGLALKP